MAADAAANRPGLPGGGVRRLDNLEAGVQPRSKRLSGFDRVWLYVPCSKIRHNFDLVYSVTIIAVVSSSGGAIVTALAIKGFR